MRRRGVNKRSSAKSFNREARKRHPYNMRGGIRL